MTLMGINDTPHSIALGSAIGIFFGFTPLLSMKTLLSIGIAWICRCNKLAAAIAVTLHDVILPFMPAIYYWQYKIGYRVLHDTWPRRINLRHLNPLEYLHPDVFMRVVWPALIGSLFLALPSAIAVYMIMRLLISRARASALVGSVRLTPTAGGVMRESPVCVKSRLRAIEVNRPCLRQRGNALFGH